MNEHVGVCKKDYKEYGKINTVNGFINLTRLCDYIVLQE